jgi:hypothetical protein
MGKKMHLYLIRILTIASLISCMLLLSSCGSPRPFKTISLEKANLAITIDLTKIDKKRSQLAGILTVSNTGRFKKKISPLQIFLHNRNDRFRTYIDAVAAFMIDYNQVELYPKDSLRLTVRWVVPLPFDTTGLYIEYTDFLGVGRVHSTDKFITRPDSAINNPVAK